MINKSILDELHRMKGDLYSRFGVVKIGCFDCFVRHNNHSLCDLNVLIELEKPLGWQYFALKEYIEHKLELHIDIFTEKALKPALKEQILSQTHFV